MNRRERQADAIDEGEATASPLDVACPVAGTSGDMPGRRGILRVVPLVLFLVLVVLAYTQGWLSALTLENVVLLHQRFHQMIESHPQAALLAYAVTYVVVGALCVPGGALLTAAGGLAFGTLLACAATVVGATAGATLLFLMARSACSDWLSRREAVWFQKLRAGFERDGFHYLLFLRLVPAFPFWFVNIAAAALGLPLRTFVVGTMIGIVPATLAYASAGAGLGNVIAMAKAKYDACLAAGDGTACKLVIPADALFSKELALALLLLGLISLLPIAIKRWRRSNA